MNEKTYEMYGGLDKMVEAWRKGFSNKGDASGGSGWNPEGNNRLTALEYLERRYRQFAILGAAMVLVSLTYFNGHIFAYPYNLILGIGMSVYFAVCSAMDWWLYRGIRSMDIYRDSVAEVSRKARYYRRCHLRFVAIIAPLMITVLAVMIISQLDNSYMIAGMVCGIVTGLLLGIRTLRRFLHEYRRLAE